MEFWVELSVAEPRGGIYTDGACSDSIDIVVAASVSNSVITSGLVDVSRFARTSSCCSVFDSSLDSLSSSWIHCPLSSSLSRLLKESVFIRL